MLNLSFLKCMVFHSGLSNNENGYFSNILPSIQLYLICRHIVVQLSLGELEILIDDNESIISQGLNSNT